MRSFLYFVLGTSKKAEEQKVLPQFYDEDYFDSDSDEDGTSAGISNN